MCGIVGMFDLREQRPVNENILVAMNDRQHHRGPDEDGIYHEPGVGLGHKRLSIIDLSNGQQPMQSADGRLVVVYNGEIYNFPELKKTLQTLGHVFQTHCDTEVILYAWRQWGADCVTRFRGMFAFALWDRDQRQLFLARDRLGIKPLYYTLLADGWLLFASELKAIRAHPDFRPALNAQAVEDYFALGYVPDPKAIYRDVHKLAPAHLMLLDAGKQTLSPREYWDVTFTDTARADSEAELRDELLMRLKEAVDIRMLAEVPLGAFLSGGVDSSAVVTAMAELSAEPVKTCSIAFDSAAYDETEYAQQVAEQYGTDHHVETVAVDDFGLVDQVHDWYDEPFADSSALPTYRVCELARKKVTVALSGDGGDENFAGYHRHRWHQLEEVFRSRIPDPIRMPLFSALGDVYPNLSGAPKLFQAKETFQGIGRSSSEGYLHNIGIVASRQRPRLYSAKLNSELAGYRANSVLQACFDRCPSDNFLEKIIYTDLKTYLPGDILVKVDRASMAHSLEVRVPLLDHKFVEWAASLSPEMKLKQRQGKYIFKKALESKLSDGILYRRKKGFSVPIGNWMRGPLKGMLHERLLEGPLPDSGLFNTDAIKSMMDAHFSGQAQNSQQLWSLLVFGNFYQANF